jgi:ABC-2 type transport system ATP-binding protein
VSFMQGKDVEFAIETVKLVKSFKAVTAVDHLDLKVPYGSIYGFLGPNGAGKTTTIKMLTGLSKPNRGQIRICGKEVHFGQVRHREDIGFLPDVPNFYDWMTAREFMAFCGHLFGIEAGTLKTRSRELLEMVGLAGVAKRIGSYSRGMKQRLGIAQAMVNNPGVLFLDEPTSALDPIGRKEIMSIMTALAGKTTVFFSTHILADIERVCDRVVILNKGKKVIEGTMAELKHVSASRTILLEVEGRDRRDEFLQLLASLDWVEQVECFNEELKLVVRDLKQAQVALPGILDRLGLGLRKFMVLEATLEDVFLKVVKE